MQKSEQIRVLKTMIGHLDAKTNVDVGGVIRNPASAYTDPARAEQEWEHFFRAYPQIIGLTGDLPEPDNFITRNDFGVPLLATRDGSGRFRAFANVCRHRGTIVESEARGKKRAFNCPFHGWTYNAEGELVGIPQEGQFGEIDKKAHCLIELPSEERFGFLFVHPQPDGELDTDALLAGLVDEFPTWRFEQLVLCDEDVYESSMNWKLANDTYGESYHFNLLHKNTLALTFYGNCQTYDTYGRNHRMGLCLKNIDTLRELSEDQWHVNLGAFSIYYLFPNIQAIVGHNGMSLVRIYPVPGEVGKSVTKISFYAWPTTLSDRPEAQDEIQRNFGATIRDEDYMVAALSQVGADSGVQKEVVFGRNEPALHHYHNTYREALGLDALPLLDA